MTFRTLPRGLLPLLLACSNKPAEAPAPKVGNAEVQPAPATPHGPALVSPRPRAAEERAPPAIPRTKLVDFSSLEALLPEAPAGWKAEAPIGQHATFGPMQISYAKRQYRKGEATLALTLSDMSMNPSVAGMPMAFSVQHEDDKGYQRPYTLAGQPGTLHWSKSGQTGQITVITSAELLLQADGHGLADPKPIEDLLARVDLAKLAALAK